MEKRFKNWQPPQIKEMQLTKWFWLVRHKDKLKLGQQTDIGAFTFINAQEGIIIEDNVQIASHCALHSVSTIDDKKGEIVLKENCRIGSHSIIMPGVTIGKNSIIGANSFVNKNIPDNVVAYGTPAKVIKQLEK